MCNRSLSPGLFLDSKRTVFFLLVIFTSLAAMAVTTQAMSISEGEPAPEFSAKAIGGDTLKLSDFKGNTVFLAFWSAWCSRCREELDFLKTLKSEHPSAVFIAINCDSEEYDEESLSKIRKSMEEWEIPFIVLIDEGLRIWEQYGVNALPSSVIIGPDGRIAFAEPNFYFASPKNLDDALHRVENTVHVELVNPIR